MEIIEAEFSDKEEKSRINIKSELEKYISNGSLLYISKKPVRHFTEASKIFISQKLMNYLRDFLREVG